MTRSVTAGIVVALIAAVMVAVLVVIFLLTNRAASTHADLTATASFMTTESPALILLPTGSPFGRVTTTRSSTPMARPS